MKRYYHATTFAAAKSILADGFIYKSKLDQIVYICESAEDAYKFVSLHVLGQPDNRIVILCVDVPDDIEVIETFDHSQTFFKCRCYGIPVDVPVSWIDVNNILVYK